MAKGPLEVGQIFGLSDVKEYHRRKRSALLDAIVDLRTGERTLSRRVIIVWTFQRSELRRANREVDDVVEAE